MRYMDPVKKVHRRQTKPGEKNKSHISMECEKKRHKRCLFLNHIFIKKRGKIKEEKRKIEKNGVGNMVKELPQIEESNITHYINQEVEYHKFETVEEMIEKTREWGVNSKTSKKEKFWYKKSFYKREVRVVGYQKFNNGNGEVAVIEFLDGNISCILPAYLKEMQGSAFGDDTLDEEGLKEEVMKKKNSVKKAEKEKTEKKKEESEKEKNQQEENPDKLVEIPDEKFVIALTVERFDKKYNAFAQRDDEIVVFKDVVVNNGEYQLTKAWAAMSKTLEALEMAEGERLECNGKLVKNEFKKEVVYKLNRPSKILKKE